MHARATGKSKGIEFPLAEMGKLDASCSEKRQCWVTGFHEGRVDSYAVMSSA